jgi:Putative amidoligase enzyme
MKNQKVAEETAVNVVTGREAKRIGIELEFFGVHYRTVIAELTRAGINVSYEGYTHRVMNSWKLVTDVSVTGTGTGLNKGLELVSPPLTSAEMEVQLKTISEVLNRIGAKVDRTCGTHVHHEIDDLTVDHIKNIYRIYTKHEEHINELMPASRRQAYNAPRGYCLGISPTEMTKIEAATTIEQIRYAQETRYRVINFQAYVKYGTIEFRQHSGSIDFTKLFNWILITQSLIASAKKKKQIKPMSESAKKRATEAFNKEVGIEYTIQGLYSRDRKKELKKAAERRAARRTA